MFAPPQATCWVALVTALLVQPVVPDDELLLLQAAANNDIEATNNKVVWVRIVAFLDSGGLVWV